MLVRRARIHDVDQITKLGVGYESKLMPYIYSKDQVTSYINSFWVAQDRKKLVGAIHCAYPSSEIDLDFLRRVKLVPLSIVKEFEVLEDAIFLGHIVCPGRGSFGDIVRSLKLVSYKLFCFLSVNSPAFNSYTRHGFEFEEEVVIWNEYKNDYSTFRYGKYTRP